MPLRLVDEGSFALAVGRELLLDLPSPDADERDNGAGDPHVRLAREANALRQRADEAREAAAAALARADGERGERERVEAELRGERHAREELATRLAQFETELGARDEALESARRVHADELERRDAAARTNTDERVAEAEAESAELRRALKAARADIELLRRERDRALERAAARTVPAPVAATPAPRDDDDPHPEQEAAQPALPIPEGEAVGAARPAAPAAPATEETAVHDEHDTGEDETEVLDEPTEALATQPNGAFPLSETEGVRVLGTPPPRRRSGDEPPAEPLPGTAEIGARHIVPGALGRGGVGRWIARIAAVLALAAVIAAVLLVVAGLR